MNNNIMKFPDDYIATIGVEPYHVENAGFIVNADCLNVLKLLPEKSIDLVLTDPPYGIDNQGKHNFTNSNVMNINYGFGGFDLDAINKFEHVLSNKGSAIIFYDNKEVTTIWDKYIEVGLKPKQILYWFKGYKGINLRHNFNSTIESAIWAVKNKDYIWNGGGNTANCFIEKYHELNCPKNNYHPTQKPLSLIKFIINLLTNADDIIIDCYLGSGTTAVAAKQLGRKFIGVEISEAYCNIAVQRLQQEILL